MSGETIEGVDYFEYDEPRVTDAWSLIGAEGRFRLRGGRAFYEGVTHWIGVRHRVRLYRVEDNCAITRRIVEPEQGIEVFEVDGDTAEALGWCGPLRYTEDGDRYREEVGS